MSEFERKLRLLAIVAAIAASLLTAAGAQGAQLFTNNYGDRTVAAFSIGGDGVLSPLAGSPFATPTYPRGIALAPDGAKLVSTYLYEEGVGSFSVAPDGTISATGPPTPVPLEGTPAISPDGRFAFVVDAGGGVNTFAIADGPPAKVSGPTGASTPEMATLTPDGRFLFLPNGDADTIERFAVGDDGGLSALPATPAVSKDAYVMRVTPDGRLALLLSDSNSDPTDELRTFAIGADGSLTDTGATLTTLGGTTGLPAISPDGRYAYFANYNEHSVSAVAIDPSGALSEVGAPIATGPIAPQSLGISADGRFLYVQPATEGVLQAFSIAADGTLTKVGSPTSTDGEGDTSTPLARPSAPVASFTAKPGGPRTKSSFDASGSSDTGAAIVSYRWDFGDGTTLTTDSPKTGHTFAAPGVYDVRLSIYDDNGCHGFIFTGQSAYCGGSDASFSLDTPPAIYRLAAKPKRFRYRLSERAKVRFTIQRKLPGRKVGKRCKRRTKANAGKRKCSIFRSVGRLKAKGKAGRNVRRFSGRLKGKPLKPGPYRLTAIATDSAGGRSTPKRSGFVVKR